jgi:phosphate transport system protein
MMNRSQFQKGLDELEREIQREGDLVARVLRGAIDAVVSHDASRADSVIAADDAIDDVYVGIERRVEELLALQAPVASDLRLILAILHINHNLERMGDQCVNIAKLTKLLGIRQLHPDITEIFIDMGGRAEQMLRVALDSLANRDAARALELTELDRLLDRNNRNITDVILMRGETADERESGLRASMVARCFERIGDNAVDIGEQTSFLVSGEVKEFEDASHPTGQP